jgi:hypothetical protein
LRLRTVGITLNANEDACGNSQLCWLILLILMTLKNPPKSSDIIIAGLIYATLIFNSAALFWRGKTHD